MSCVMGATDISTCPCIIEEMAGKGLKPAQATSVPASKQPSLRACGELQSDHLSAAF